MSRFQKFVVAWIAVVAFELTTPTVVHAYALSGGKWPQPGLCGPNCLGTPLTITYSFQNMFDGAIKMPDGSPLPPSIIRSSIEEALGLWASVTPITFQEVVDDGLPYGSSSQFGTIRFRHISINGPDPIVGQPIAKAQAYFPAGPDYSGDVEFDDTDRWLQIGTLHQPDILGAAIHEIGHTLGLDHTFVSQPGEFWVYQVYDQNSQVIDHYEPKGAANMFWIFNRFTGPGSGFLFQDDIAGIQAVYGSGSGRVNSLVPEPSTMVLLIAAAASMFFRRRVR